jgi:Tfp pilus assembly PilM family ATPase/Tfp pilus assembly protein PilN
MYKKTFVSISFSPNKIQIAQLDQTKKKIVKLGEADIPKGVIDHYKVADQKTLSKVVSEAWRKFGIKEKSVGIIVPEFSTFTKSLTLPQLSVKELDEAVRWQAQEFLPDAGKSMILDWKIIRTHPEEHQILLVAISTDILSGFVESVADAKLYPLIVETPSLSILRVSDGQDETRIIVYSNLGEAILIVAKGEKILGSVVVNSGDQMAVSKAVYALYSRYADEVPKKIVLAGMQISRALYDDLAKFIKLPIEWAKINILGVSSNQIQEYLIPISMQLKDPTEPSDENTINLLPPNWVKHYERKHLKRRLWTLVLISSFVVGICFVAVISSFVFLATRETTLKNLTTQSNAKSNDVSTQVQAINAVATKVNKVAGHIKATKIVNQIASAKPGDVVITDYNIDLEGGTINIKGIAGTRQSLVDLKKSLEETKDFSGINIPLSSILVEQNINFELNFLYIPLAPKKISAPTISIH